MADAISEYGILRSQQNVEAHTSKKVTGIVMNAAMELRVHEESGTFAFVVSYLEIDLASGLLTAGGANGANVADTSWTTVYTCPTGKIALVSLEVTNVGETAGSFSCGVTATEVVGEGSGV